MKEIIVRLLCRCVELDIQQKKNLEVSFKVSKWRILDYKLRAIETVKIESYNHKGS